MIVGFVNMSTETPISESPSQPICVGAGAFSDMEPGQPVVINAEEEVGEDILRGSGFDAHLGCFLLFRVEVPADLSTYTLTLVGHPPLTLERGLLEEFGWQIDLWTDGAHMQADCGEPEEGASEMTCLLLEPHG